MEGTKSFSHEQNGSALTSELLIRMAVALHLSYSTEWPALTSDMEGTKSFSHEKNGSGLTSDLVVKMTIALTYFLLDRMASTHI